MKAEKLFEETYGTSVPHSWCAYNGKDMVKFAEEYAQHSADERYEMASKHWDSKRNGLKVKGPATTAQANSVFDLIVECIKIASGKNER